jgi:integrase
MLVERREQPLGDALRRWPPADLASTSRGDGDDRSFVTGDRVARVHKSAVPLVPVDHEIFTVEGPQRTDKIIVAYAGIELGSMSLVESLSKPSGIEAVFDNHGRAVDPRYVRNALSRLGVKVGLEKRVHPHGLRHSLAFDLATSGTPTHQIQAALGHSSLAVTDRYVRHIAPADVVANYALSRVVRNVPSTAGCGVRPPTTSTQWRS